MHFVGWNSLCDSNLRTCKRLIRLEFAIILYSVNKCNGDLGCRLLVSSVVDIVLLGSIYKGAVWDSSCKFECTIIELEFVIKKNTTTINW